PSGGQQSSMISRSWSAARPHRAPDADRSFPFRCGRTGSKLSRIGPISLSFPCRCTDSRICDRISNMEFSIRDDLIDKVRRGEMKPAEAEAEAARLGMKPFAVEADPVEFDPFRETWWTLPMTITWIAWRSPDRVREWWDRCRSE